MPESQTIFQLTRKVLDQLRADVVEVYGDKADAVVKARCEALRVAYAKLTNPDRVPVDYSAPEDRLAYVYGYVGAHADFVYQILRSTSKILGNDLLSRDKLVVTALGGGPGSDLLRLA